MSHEQSQQENAQQLWDAAMQVIQTTEPGTSPHLLDHAITTVPPESKAPEQISLTLWSDGSWTDKYHTLAFTAMGAVSYEYSLVSWNPPTPEDDIKETYGPDAPETLDYLQSLIRQLSTE